MTAGGSPQAEGIDQRLGRGDDFCHVAGDEGVAAGGAEVVGPAGEGEDIAVVLGGVAGGHQRTAFGLGLYHNHRAHQSRDDAVPAEEVQRHRRSAYGIVGDKGAAGRSHHADRQRLVLPRIDGLDAGREDADGGNAAAERRVMGDKIGPVGHSADDGGLHGGLGQRLHQLPAPGLPVGADVARPHHPDQRPQAENLRRRAAAVEVKPERRVLAFQKRSGVVLLSKADEAEAPGTDLVQFPCRPVQKGRGKLRRQFGMRRQPWRGSRKQRQRAPGLFRQFPPQPGMISKNLVQCAQRHPFVVFFHAAKVRRRNEIQHNRWKDCVVSHENTYVSYDAVLFRYTMSRASPYGPKR